MICLNKNIFNIKDLNLNMESLMYLPNMWDNYYDYKQTIIPKRPSTLIVDNWDLGNFN